jgi:alpha-N-arabinofuranosidase
LPDARVVIDPSATIAELDERLFGGVIEHMGRAIYGGIYEPGHHMADADGWRRDVVDLIRRLGVTVVRYPGGNFVSGYDWEDGVGPREARPTRFDRAWRSIEPNEVGTDDFLRWARLAGVEPMLAVNLGSRGAVAARDLVEYCNGQRGSALADLRAANGHPDPYGVRLWCLGNEMDGPWQIGFSSAVEYARSATEAAVAMRLVDPTIELIACGSSGSSMPTFGMWEETVLDHAWELIDHISVHAYFDPATFSSVDDYLACAADLDRTIVTVSEIVDDVAARHVRDHTVGLSVDEWNVWRLADHQAREAERRTVERSPALAEDTADVADALVVGSLLLTLLRHADRVRLACVAQLVNVIPLIRTIDDGPAWLQPTAFPFADVARWARGSVLRLHPDGAGQPTHDERAAPLDVVAVHDAATGALSCFLLNGSASAIALDVELRDLGDLSLDVATVLTDADLRASNSADRPERVRPRRATVALDEGRLDLKLPARSWTVIHMVRPAAATDASSAHARSGSGTVLA